MPRTIRAMCKGGDWGIMPFAIEDVDAISVPSFDTESAAPYGYVNGTFMSAIGEETLKLFFGRVKRAAFTLDFSHTLQSVVATNPPDWTNPSFSESLENIWSVDSSVTEPMLPHALTPSANEIVFYTPPDGDPRQGFYNLEYNGAFRTRAQVAADMSPTNLQPEGTPVTSIPGVIVANDWPLVYWSTTNNCYYISVFGSVQANFAYNFGSATDGDGVVSYSFGVDPGALDVGDEIVQPPAALGLRPFATKRLPDVAPYGIPCPVLTSTSDVYLGTILYPVGTLFISDPSSGANYFEFRDSMGANPVWDETDGTPLITPVPTTY